MTKKPASSAKPPHRFGRAEIADLWLVTETISPISAAEVSTLEAKLGTAMPAGYGEIMLRAGAGYFANELRVRPPGDVLAKGERLASSGYFDVAPTLWLNFHDEIGKSGDDLVNLATSKNGDEVFFRKGAPDRLWMLPRGRPEVYPVGNDLPSLLAWFARNDIIGRIVRTFYYNSELSQKRTVYTAQHPDGHTVDQLSETIVKELDFDHHDGGDRPEEFFFRSFDGMIWTDTVNSPLGLVTFADVSPKAQKRLDEALAKLGAKGWVLKKKKR